MGSQLCNLTVIQRLNFAMNSTEAIERTRAVIRRQQKNFATVQTYLHWLRHNMFALGKLPKTLTNSWNYFRVPSQLNRMGMTT